MTQGSASIELAAMELFEAAMDHAPGSREIYIRQNSTAGDAVKQRALELLATDRVSLASLRTGGASALHEEDEAHPERIGAYRILRLLGHGGMGAVYMGERAADDFEHVVAIKLIKPGLLSAALIDRFRRERQILAQLNHRHIAHLHDGGETEDGAPFIVMEYIDGVSLTEWAEREKPDAKRRLDLFLQVCDAVEFAHQNLIVHRDLTPSNVLVAEGDEAKLIDFGIARPQIEDGVAGHPTSSFSGMSLTPGFAAPERARGEAANTLLDIYSLGQILRELTRHDAAPELAAIAAKATQADPEDRYATVRGLMDDLKRYRGGKSVSVFSTSNWYRVRKFVAREKLIVGATAAVLMMLFAGLAATGWAYNRAETARVSAEQRFTQVRRLAKSIMFDTYDRVAEVEGSTDVRAYLAGISSEYLESLAVDENAPPEVRLEAGEGYFRLAAITGQHGGSSLGRITEGKQYFAKADALLTALHTDYPQMQAASISLGDLHAKMALQSLKSDGDSKAARYHAQKALAALSNAPRDNVRAAAARAEAMLYLGDTYGWDNDIPGAGKVYRKAIAAVNAMPKAVKSSIEVRRILSGLMRQNGEVSRYTGENEAAIEQLNETVILARGILAEQPDDDALIFLTESLWSLGDMYRVAKRWDLSLNAINEAIDITRRQSAADASNATWYSMIALTETVLAQTESERGSHADALKAAEEVIRIKRNILKRSGNDKGRLLYLAVGLKDMAPIYQRADKTAQACAMWLEAFSIMEARREAGTLSDFDIEQNFNPIVAGRAACIAR